MHYSKKIKGNIGDYIKIFIVSIISFFPGLWIDRATLMEARNFVTAREMVRNGNWLIPTMNGEFRFAKPPIPTWLTAIFMKIFGNTTNEFILRLPIAILSVVLIFLVYHMVKKLTKDSRFALISACVVSTTFMIMKLGNDNTWDLFTYIFMFGSISFIISGFKSGKKKEFIISGFFMGISILSKGPVALYGMFLPFAISYCFIYTPADFKNNWKKLLLSLTIGIFTALMWPIAVMIHHSELFLQVMKRETETWSNRHVRSVFYYVDYIIYIGVWLPFAVASFFKRWSEKRGDQEKFFSFVFFWNVFALILLSLIKMKKKRYGIPMYVLTPMMASYLISYYIKTPFDKLMKSDKVLIKVHTFLVTLGSIGIPVMFYFMGVRKGLVGWPLFALVSAVYLGLFIVFLRNRTNLKKLIYFTGIFMLCVGPTATWFSGRIIGEGEKTHYKPLSSLRSDERYRHIYTVDDDWIEIVWNTGGIIQKIDSAETLPEHFFLIENLEEKELGFLRTAGYEIVDKKTYYKYEKEDELIHIYRVEKEKTN